ncbi:MAG: pyruvate kinase, partial [Gammaproteobacteria bacterium]
MGIITNIRLLDQRRTKILVTLGPASSDPAIIRRLILAGANVIRLNMSHGDHASHAQCYHHVRAIAADLAAPLAIVADLCGPKIRVGKFPDGEIALASGSEFVKKPTALGISRSGGARNPHVFQYTLRFLRSGGTRPPFA